MAPQKITPAECRQHAARLRQLAKKQPWAAVSHRQAAAWWDLAAIAAAK